MKRVLAKAEAEATAEAEVEAKTEAKAQAEVAAEAEVGAEAEVEIETKKCDAGMLPKHVARHTPTIAASLAGLQLETATSHTDTHTHTHIETALATAAAAAFVTANACPDLAFDRRRKRILIADCQLVGGFYSFQPLFAFRLLTYGGTNELPRIQQLALIICYGFMFDLIAVPAAFPKVCSLATPKKSLAKTTRESGPRLPKYTS